MKRLKTTLTTIRVVSIKVFLLKFTFDDFAVSDETATISVQRRAEGVA